MEKLFTCFQSKCPKGISTLQSLLFGEIQMDFSNLLTQPSTFFLSFCIGVFYEFEDVTVFRMRSNVDGLLRWRRGIANDQSRTR